MTWLKMTLGGLLVCGCSGKVADRIERLPPEARLDQKIQDLRSKLAELDKKLTAWESCLRVRKDSECEPLLELVNLSLSSRDGKHTF